MQNLRFLIAFFSTLLVCWPAQSQEQHGHTHQPAPIPPVMTRAAHSHQQHQLGPAIPIGVMGGHMHPAGEWMISLGVMGSGMGGLLNQSTPISRDEALKDFLMVPETMLMGMPMLNLMYAPTDHLTLMAMLPGMAMNMSHHSSTGHLHTLQATDTQLTNMHSGGLGDISLHALLGNWRFENHHLHFNLGLSLPTGAIDLSQGGDAQPLPYAMRLGSGTWDLLPGLTYTGHLGPWCWGLQPAATLRIGQTNLSYRLGHRFQSSGWLSYRFNEWLSTSLRLQGQLWGNAEGSDKRLDPAMLPGADPSRLGGSRLDLLLGLNLVPWPGQRLGLEAGLPVYQQLSGPQIGTQWLFQAAWQTSF